MITISWKRKVRGKNVVNKKIMKVKSILNLKLHIGKRLDMRVSTSYCCLFLCKVLLNEDKKFTLNHISLFCTNAHK